MPIDPEDMTHKEILADLKKQMDTIYKLVEKGEASAFLCWLSRDETEEDDANLESQFIVNPGHCPKCFINGVGDLLTEVSNNMDSENHVHDDKLVH